MTIFGLSVSTAAVVFASDFRKSFTFCNTAGAFSGSGSSSYAPPAAVAAFAGSKAGGGRSGILQPVVLNLLYDFLMVSTSWFCSEASISSGGAECQERLGQFGL